MYLLFFLFRLRSFTHNIISCLTIQYTMLRFALGQIYFIHRHKVCVKVLNAAEREFPIILHILDILDPCGWNLTNCHYSMIFWPNFGSRFVLYISFRFHYDRIDTDRQKRKRTVKWNATRCIHYTHDIYVLRMIEQVNFRRIHGPCYWFCSLNGIILAR